MHWTYDQDDDMWRFVDRRTSTTLGLAWEGQGRAYWSAKDRYAVPELNLTAAKAMLEAHIQQRVGVTP